MTTEHVSVPRDIRANIESLLRRISEVQPPNVLMQQLEQLGEARAILSAILSRATSSDVPAINIKCETHAAGITGTTTLPVIRVEREDDGSLTAITNHWPSAPRAVTEEMALAVRKEWESWARSGHTLNRAWIEALKSFATSLPVEIPPGYVLVPVEPTEDMYDEVESLTRCEELDLRAIYKAMLAAAPRHQEKDCDQDD